MTSLESSSYSNWVFFSRGTIRKILNSKKIVRLIKTCYSYIRLGLNYEWSLTFSKTVLGWSQAVNTARDQSKNLHVFSISRCEKTVFQCDRSSKFGFWSEWYSTTNSSQFDVQNWKYNFEKSQRIRDSKMEVENEDVMSPFNSQFCPLILNFLFNIQTCLIIPGWLAISTLRATQSLETL